MKMLLLSTMYMCIYDILMFMGWFMCYATFDKYLLWQVRMRSTRKPDSAQAGLIWYLPLLFLFKNPPGGEMDRDYGDKRDKQHIDRDTLLFTYFPLWSHCIRASCTVFFPLVTRICIKWCIYSSLFSSKRHSTLWFAYNIEKDMLLPKDYPMIW